MTDRTGKPIRKGQIVKVDTLFGFIKAEVASETQNNHVKLKALHNFPMFRPLVRKGELLDAHYSHIMGV